MNNNDRPTRNNDEFDSEANKFDAEIKEIRSAQERTDIELTSLKQRLAHLTQENKELVQKLQTVDKKCADFVRLFVAGQPLC